MHGDITHDPFQLPLDLRRSSSKDHKIVFLMTLVPSDYLIAVLVFYLYFGAWNVSGSKSCI